MYCSHCYKTKNLMKQSKHIRKDGTIKQYFMCRSCNTKRLRLYRKTKEGMKKTRQAIHRSTIKYIEKQRARMILNYHLNKGYIKKESCKCGSKKVEAHHPSYEKPLIVEWMCRSCHATKHRELKLSTATTGHIHLSMLY